MIDKCDSHHLHLLVILLYTYLFGHLLSPTSILFSYVSILYIDNGSIGRSVGWSAFHSLSRANVCMRMALMMFALCLFSGKHLTIFYFVCFYVY